VIGAEANGAGEEGEEKAWGAEDGERKKREREPGECIVDVREHDIAYYLRVAIDLGRLQTTLNSQADNP
jgi:DNA polymerase epsilon subunit 1